MSYFGQGWEPRREPQRRWQDGEDGMMQDDEDEEYGGMERGAPGRGGWALGRDRGYRPLGAGYRGGGGWFAERQRQEKNKTWLGTMGKTREKGGHEAARSVWDLARDNSRADEAAEDRVRCSENDTLTRRNGAV